MSLRGYRLASRALASTGGERRAGLVGPGGEFRDYRPYQPGDDPRHVDWNVYARSGRLVTRQFHAEQSARVYLSVDVSASMTPRQAATRTVSTFLRQFARSDAWKERELPGLTAGLTTLANEPSGLVIVVSDGLEHLDGLRGALWALATRGFDLSFIELLSRADLHPPAGDWTLKDVETGESLDVDDEARRYYLRALDRHQDALAKLVRGVGFRFTRLLDDARSPAVWTALRRAGIVVKGG
ncbi:MAG TPA: DUF58 domain-containing protein [Deinococcales bacterium]|nr:DUF58 domain-containing protein [Deinococcales bacterium]